MKKNILIFGDDEMNITILIRILKQLQFNVDVDNHSEECIKKVTQNTYDLILMDYLMPDINGGEALQELQKIKKLGFLLPKCILITANTEKEAYSIQQKYGFDVYLLKPIAYDKLTSILMKYLGEI